MPTCELLFQLLNSCYSSLPCYLIPWLINTTLGFKLSSLLLTYVPSNRIRIKVSTSVIGLFLYCYAVSISGGLVIGVDQSFIFISLSLPFVLGIHDVPGYFY